MKTEISCFLMSHELRFKHSMWILFCEHAKALGVIALEEKEADYSGSGILEGMRVQGVLKW
jgi:hypothetical protein